MFSGAFRSGLIEVRSRGRAVLVSCEDGAFSGAFRSGLIEAYPIEDLPEATGANPRFSGAFRSGLIEVPLPRFGVTGVQRRRIVLRGFSLRPH